MDNDSSKIDVMANQRSSQQTLFRSEVLVSQNSQWLGAIRLAQPLSNWLIAGLSMIVAVGLALFLVFGSINKKVRVTGITTPVGGSLTIFAPNAGVLVHRFVAEGQQVVGGQPLFELSTERQNGLGEMTALLAQQLSIRQQSLTSERQTRLVQDGEKRRVLDARVQNMSTEVVEMEQEIALAQRRESLSRETVKKYQTLETSGFVSPTQTQQRQEELIDVSARLGTLLRGRVQLHANQLNAQAEIADLAGNLATALTQLDRAEASLKQEMLENQNRKTSLITAPMTGTVTTISNEPGQAVNASQVLATLIPNSRAASGATDEMEAHLYASSRTVGFVAPGQDVLIRYQAFPYQKFGLYHGTVTDVSRTPFAPSELPANVASTILTNAQQTISGFNGNEALYRVKVKLARQSVDAYGKKQTLKAGMTLEADLMQDKRKIWEWVFEPVLAMSLK